MIEPSLLMKAKQEDKNTSKDYNGWIAETKFDGVSSQIIVNGLNNIRIYSGNKTESGEFNEYTYKLPHVVNSIRKQLSSVPDIYKNQKYQGELIIKTNKRISREEAFTYVTGTLNADDALARQMEKYKIHFVCYNIPTMDEPYGVIISRIAALFPLKNSDTETYVLSPLFHIVGETYTLEELYEAQISAGEEGIVIYNPLGRYKHAVKTNPRTSDCVKIKDKNECEVKVTDIVEGIGKRTGKVGALICEDGSGNVVRIGSFKNFSDKDLETILQMKSQVPFIVDMAYHSKTADSYRNPRLVRIRTDKTVEEWTK